MKDRDGLSKLARQKDRACCVEEKKKEARKKNRKESILQTMAAARTSRGCRAGEHCLPAARHPRSCYCGTR